jgi:hypothetical protein
MSTTTLRKWFNKVDADWETLIIILHTVKDNNCPGWEEAENSFKFDFRNKKLQTPDVKEFLDTEFYSGHGFAKAPRFIAEDKDRIYFPSKYDGATCIEMIYKDIDKYIDIKNETPYPGGG